MKQTAEDRNFATRFAGALEPHVTRDRDRGMSLAEIAGRLGVTAAGLQKQLAGGTPSIRTVAFAYAVYGVSVDYGKIAIAKAISARRKPNKGRRSDEQMHLPFEITAPVTSSKLQLVPVKSSVRRYRLHVTIGL